MKIFADFPWQGLENIPVSDYKDIAIRLSFSEKFESNHFAEDLSKKLQETNLVLTKENDLLAIEAVEKKNHSLL